MKRHFFQMKFILGTFLPKLSFFVSWTSQSLSNCWKFFRIISGRNVQGVKSHVTTNSTFVYSQESKRMKRSKGTEIEFSYLLPLGKTSWPSKVNTTKEDKATTMDLEMLPKIAKMSPKEGSVPSAQSELR